MTSRQAFISVEKDYLDSIDSLLAQKAKLQCEIPDGISHYEVDFHFHTVCYLTYIIGSNRL